MRIFIILALLLATACYADNISPDIENFGENKKTEVHDFVGEYKFLSTIQAKIPSNGVIYHLEGNFPKLNLISLVGTSGALELNMQGKFQRLQNVQVVSTSGDLNIALNNVRIARSEWTIDATSGNIRLSLPKEFPVEITVFRTTGRISAASEYVIKETGWKSTVYVIADQKAAPMHKIQIRVTSGDVYLTSH